ncbi:MAG: YkgJ family cysteine cluster protein [Candidatus Bathyarchaeota archaeon]|nr:YkgJ family cysteine cluster protein [Candidatus Bathyarchaeum tardum]WGM88760.1 MAG: YkgJ family cysteine cluster protein [Candidatus Bathyarchaeum tardum]WNZ28986.1 MAG: YkgJ family cysteine cluster protein [Candidatus Bathyarchaeota archaeon]
MNNVVAILTVNHKKRTIRDLKITQKQFKFKCKRGATLCCKLGGPILSKKDLNQILSKGHSEDDFLEPVTSETEPSAIVCGSLKTKSDGSCIFLSQDEARNNHNCIIYNNRPALCRLYPFTFELLSPNRIALKFIPCCMGLNDPEGKNLDERFISSALLEPLLDAIELTQNETD